MLNRIWFIKTFYLNKNKSGIQVIIQQNTLFPLQLSLQSNLTMKHLTCYSDRKRFYTWFCLFFFSSNATLNYRSILLSKKNTPWCLLERKNNLCCKTCFLYKPLLSKYFVAVHFLQNLLKQICKISTVIA